MGIRGRASIHALASVKSIHAIRRPDAPDHLNEKETAVWEQVVGRMPEDWFPAETLPMLEMYCVHICLHRYLAEQLRKDVSKADIEAITKQADIVMKLATKMRITQQSAFDKRKSRKTRVTGLEKKPWQKDQEDE